MENLRIKKLQELVEQTECDAYLVDDTINLFYLIGIELSAGRLIVTPQAAKLYVDGRYFETCQKNAPVPVFSIEENAFEGIKTLGFNSEKTTYAQYQKLQQKLKVQPLDDLVATLRMIKDETELQLLRDAAKLGSKGYDFLRTLLKEGVSEKNLAVELDIFWKRQGGKAVAFDPIIAFGPNSSMPHYRAGESQLQQGDTVLFDIGVTLNHYHSDMTRVEFFGEANSKIRQVYDVVKKAQQEALKLCKPGIKIGNLDKAARDYITQEGYGESFTHNLGHGIGLEVHEKPALRNKAPEGDGVLKKGMVITIEPGVYLPGIGGVRLEDTIAITDQGYENLTLR